jgi:hypothetical protein
MMMMISSMQTLHYASEPTDQAGCGACQPQLLLNSSTSTLTENSQQHHST